MSSAASSCDRHTGSRAPPATPSTSSAAFTRLGMPCQSRPRHPGRARTWPIRSSVGTARRTDLRGAGFEIPGHRTVMNRKPTFAWISAQVRACHPVIVGMDLPRGGTHFIVLTGLNGTSDFWVNDPWDQNGIHVTFSGDWDDRGKVYE